MGGDVFAEGGVDAALVALAGLFEKGEDVGVEAEGDLLLVFCGDERAGAGPGDVLLGGMSV